MASTLFVSKNDHIFIWDYCLLILWKHFWEDEISPGSQLPEKPWSMLAMEGGALFQPSCTHTSCQHSCLLWGMDLLSLWPCSLRAYLSLGKSEFYAHYLGLHVYLVKSMRFIQVANPDGKWPGAMVVWPLEWLYMAFFHRDSPRALLPSFHRALFHGCPSGSSWNAVALTPHTEKAGNPLVWSQTSLAGLREQDDQTFEWFWFLREILFYERFTLSKVMNMEYQILCCYPAKIILMESVCSTLQVARSSKLL